MTVIEAERGKPVRHRRGAHQLDHARSQHFAGVGGVRVVASSHRGSAHRANGAPGSTAQ